jgi:steroid delta-isomerase-like uncharacterized protein
MSAEENKAVVRRSVEEGWNTGDVANADQFYAPDYVHHDPTQPQARDLQGLKEWALGMAAAFPDVQTAIEDLIAEGDRVVKRYTIRGTHRGELLGIPPSGKQIAVPGVTIYRLEGGKIVEGWWHSDALGLLQQLGAIPAPEQVLA